MSGARRRKGRCTSPSKIGTSEALKLQSEFLKEVECPVCFEYLLNEVSICRKGHSICQSCKNKLNPRICPTCTCDFDEGRNYILEKLVLNFKFPCQNEGCPVILPAAQIKIHKNKCEHKAMECLLSFQNCTWKGSHLGLNDHFKTQHMKYLQSWVPYINPPDNIIKRSCTVLVQHNIFVVLQREDENESLFMAQSIKDFHDYNFRLEFVSKLSDSITYSYQRPCSEFILKNGLPRFYEGLTIAVPINVIIECHPLKVKIINGL